MYKYIAVMAIVTYLIRVIPLTVFHKKIKNKFLKSFLYYVPYTCLSAMTFPAILYATQSVFSATAGVITAMILAFYNRSLIVVAASSCAVVFIVEQIISIL